MKTVSIIQSNYIPWKGYFDIINSSDEFILYDDVQYTKRDWRNRNKLKTSKGEQWITLPVIVSGEYDQKIKDTAIDGSKWMKSHWGMIQANYSKAPYFKDYKQIISTIYEEASKNTLLSDVNFIFLTRISEILGIETLISRSMDYQLVDGQTERLVELCKTVGADQYISGSAAKDYMDVNLFSNENIEVVWKDYSGYPEYSQQFSPFSHYVSVIDLIFNVGPDAAWYIWGWRDES